MTDIPPGWYDDPENPVQHRYWDGDRWSEHRAPKVAPPTYADRGAFAIVTTGWNLFTRTWVSLLGIGAIILVAVLIALAIALVDLASMLDPGLGEIINRVFDSDFDSEKNPADKAFLDSITLDWSVWPVIGLIVAFIVLYATVLLGTATSTVLLASVHVGRRRRAGQCFALALRRAPRWIGIELLWSLSSMAALAITFGILVLAFTTPILLLLVVPATIAALVYCWPYWFLARTTLFLASTDDPPFRRTIALVRPNWGPIALRVRS